MCKQKDRAIMYWYTKGQRRCLCGRQLVWSGNGSNLATIDHIVPKSRGGTRRLTNLLIVCQGCNHERGNKKLSIWAKEKSLPKLKWIRDKEKLAMLTLYEGGPCSLQC